MARAAEIDADGGFVAAAPLDGILRYSQSEPQVPSPTYIDLELGRCSYVPSPNSRRPFARQNPLRNIHTYPNTSS